MNLAVYSVVIDYDGARGVIASHDLNNQEQILITLEGGRRIFVPANLLVERENGTYYIPVSLAEYSQGAQNAGASSDADDNQQVVLPIIQEEAVVQKRWVETGRVRLSKVINEREETVEEELLREHVNVERVPVNRVIDEPMPTRYEGETLIIPVVEEVLVVEKRYMLKEEVRVTKRQETEPVTQAVTLQAQDVIVERINPDISNHTDSRSS
jgi:uncharacterized protein (TIGR02271 family)